MINHSETNIVTTTSQDNKQYIWSLNIEKHQLKNQAIKSVYTWDLLGNEHNQSMLMMSANNISSLETSKTA